jgi:hypothetical protein
MKTAQEFGQEAFSRNCPWNPALDTEFMESIATITDKTEAIAEWKQGWIQESLTICIFKCPAM